MQNINYNSPNGMYPLQTTDNNSPAFGAGTVPGSFMAGMMLPERMQDYRTARDLSNQSSLLQNQHLAAANEDYNLASPSRVSGYNLLTNQNQSNIGLLPEQTRLAHIGLEGQLEQAPMKNKTDYQKVLNSLPTENRREFGAKLEHIGTVSQMFKDKNGDWIGGDKALPQIATEISRMTGEAIDPSHLNGVSQMLPDIRKYNAEMNKQAAMDSAHMEREKVLADATIRRAEIMASRGFASDRNNAERQRQDAEVLPILEKLAREEDLTPAEWAKFKVYQIRTNEATAKAGANALGGAQTGTGALDILSGKQPKITTTPKPDTGIVKPEQGQQETQKYQGHTYRLKKGKDRYDQSNWEKID